MLNSCLDEIDKCESVVPDLKIGEIFDRWSDDYEMAIRKKVPQYNVLQRVFFDLLHFRRDEEIDVLDLGLGSGENAGVFLQRHPRARLVGIDVSKKMIQRARLRLADFASRLELVQSDFRTLCLLQRFDFVYSILAVHHLSAEDKQNLFRGIWSLLTPGGAFLLIDVVKGSTEELTERYVNLTFPFDVEDSPSSLMEHLRWLSEAGFEKVDVPWKHYKIAAVIGFKGNST
jgi:tRNA (cmo5U34)-methyltransferase